MKIKLTNYELRRHWEKKTTKILMRIIHNEFMGIGSNHEESVRRINEIASKFNVLFMKIKLTTIGFYSFLTKKVYKSIELLKVAEYNFKVALNAIYEEKLKKAKQTIQDYKDYAKELLSQRPSFLRWSNIKECAKAIHEEIQSLPKSLRMSINTRF